MHTKLDDRLIAYQSCVMIIIMTIRTQLSQHAAADCRMLVAVIAIALGVLGAASVSGHHQSASGSGGRHVAMKPAWIIYEGGNNGSRVS
jgi:hypothetical protein